MAFALDIFHDLDQAHDPSAVEALLDCDGIHLSGGNTKAFLKRVRSSGIAEPLRKWTSEGGVLVGTSAGAILMTPTIALDALFSNEQPEGVHDGAALDLVPFEFFPHLNAKSSYLPELIRYSRFNSRVIAACPDGGGVVLSNNGVEGIGEIIWISNGVVVEAPKQFR